jgi:hypothetical protein
MIYFMCHHLIGTSKKIRKTKVKFTPEQATKAQRGSRAIALLFSLTSALDERRWTMPHPDHFCPWKTDAGPI